eukprot:6197558-Pyramimonas_sp.AAC.1
MATRSMSLLGDATPSLLIYIPWLTERWRRWLARAPTGERVVLLARGAGGRRHIALFQATYRARWQVRGQQLRDCLLLARGPASPRPRARLPRALPSRAFVAAEAAVSDDSGAVAAIVDIAK